VIQVFSSLLGKDLKVSAEEIEIGLVKPNASLAKLHIQLLKVLSSNEYLFTCFLLRFVWLGLVYYSCWLLLID
jgi:hypothetical protein